VLGRLSIVNNLQFCENLTLVLLRLAKMRDNTEVIIQPSVRSAAFSGCKMAKPV
jgi:hypothetical protein